MIASQTLFKRGQQARLYVYFPLPLAAAIGLEAGEEVQWELLERGELHLLRPKAPEPSTRQRAAKSAEKPAAPGKHPAN